MNNIIEYQNGLSAAGEFEVMLESTANLYAESSLGARCTTVDNDIAIMGGDYNVENDTINLERALAYARGEGSRPFEFC